MTDVRAVRIAFAVAERVVLAMVRDPGDHGSLDGRGAEQRQGDAHPARGLEAAMRQVTVEPDRHPERSRDVERHEQHHVGDAQRSAPRLPRGDAEQQERDDDRAAGDDPIGRLVRDRLDVVPFRR